MILWAVDRSRATITVSASLKAVLADAGADAAKLHVIRNGVDLERFAPRERSAARHKLGVDGFVVLTVGKLDDNKGHDLVIEALKGVPATLMIVGEGEQRAKLERQAALPEFSGRVRLVGAVRQEDLPDYYAAADVLVLASGREGMPNVVLEALACGLPVIATDVGGVGEVLREAPGCTLLPERSSSAIAAALGAAVRHMPDRARVRRYAERFSWVEVIAAQLELLRAVRREGGSA